MPNDLSFYQSLSDPESGKDFPLYSNLAETPGLPDSPRIQKLKEDTRKGLVGLQYLTGLKKRTGQTFYDEHPIQASLTDALANSGKIGLGLGGAAALTNYLRQRSNMHLTEPASMARTNNPNVDVTHPANLLSPREGGTRQDISSIFGDMETNPQKRLDILGRLSGQTGKASKAFSKEYSNIEKSISAANKQYDSKLNKLYNELEKAKSSTSKNRVQAINSQISQLEKQQGKAVADLQTKLKKFMASSGRAEGAEALNRYVDLHESLRRAKAQGGLKGYVGEGLHSLLGEGKVSDFAREHLLPGKHQAIADLLEKYKLTKAHPGYDEELIKDIVGSYIGDRKLTGAEGKAFLKSTMKRIADQGHQYSGIRKAFNRVKFPGLLGAGVALGGMGLHRLMKAIQENAYSKDKQREWKKTLLQSRGEFDKANQL